MYASKGPPLSPTPEASFPTAAPSKTRSASTWEASPRSPKTGPSPTVPWPNPLDELAAVADGRVVLDRDTKNASHSTFPWGALPRSRIAAPSSAVCCRQKDSNCCTTASAALRPPPITTPAVLPWTTTALSPVTAALVNTTPLPTAVEGDTGHEQGGAGTARGTAYHTYWFMPKGSVIVNMTTERRHTGDMPNRTRGTGGVQLETDGGGRGSWRGALKCFQELPRRQLNCFDCEDFMR